MSNASEGAKAEDRIVRHFTDLGIPAHTTCASGAYAGDNDVEVELEQGNMSLQVKSTERDTKSFVVPKKVWEKCEEQSNDAIPAVVLDNKGDEPMIVMTLEDFIWLLRNHG